MIRTLTSVLNLLDREYSSSTCCDLWLCLVLCMHRGLRHVNTAVGACNFIPLNVLPPGGGSEGIRERPFRSVSSHQLV